ncbi:MAG: hypothetical protein AAFQ52_11380 [Chloroflexota bacterium]
MNHIPERSVATVLMWLAYLGVVVFSVISMGAWSILLAFVMMIPLFMMSGMIWNMFNNKGKESASSASKSKKRNRKERKIDNLLDDMSADDLHHLRQRLADISDDLGYDAMTISDDGELVRREQNT